MATELEGSVITRSALDRMIRQPLFRKYAVVCVCLVGGVLLTSGSLEIYFSYQENRAALVSIQHEKAAGAAALIARFIRDIERQATSALQAPPIGSDITEQRRVDYVRLFRQAPAVTEIRHLDDAGREQLHLSRVAMDVTGSAIDFSHSPAFREPRSGRTYFGPVYFRDDSEPYVTISVSEPAGAGVTAVEVNLKFSWDVVSRISVGKDGYALVVDADGQLVAHPDISLVLQKTDLSALPQIAAALRPSTGPREPLNIGRSLAGHQVLTASEAIIPPGWTVFVEQPLEEAFAPLYSSVLRTAVLLVAGLLLSILASLVLAGRMVRPIRALQAGSARIGAGALDQRIDVRTGDELEALAEEFNRMTERLRDSYAHLEAKVDERTAALGEALRALEAKSRELEVASRHKSEFLANMSHELRTPLHAIIGFSEVLSAEMVGEVNAEQRDFLDDITSSGRHLLSLINDVLDMSKIEAGHMALDIGPVTLRDVLEQGLTIVREAASRRRITLSLAVPAQIDTIQADERKLKQVIFNLVSNAVKFTPDGGHVDVLACRLGSDVQVAVRDTGIGIAPEDQERIFEEFLQVGTANGGPREGTGLGLALARRFVQLHGGKLEVESTPGEGSSFMFTLPQPASDTPVPDERHVAVSD